jgi:hypothetical protein
MSRTRRRRVVGVECAGGRSWALVTFSTAEAAAAAMRREGSPPELQNCTARLIDLQRALLSTGEMANVMKAHTSHVQTVLDTATASALPPEQPHMHRGTHTEAHTSAWMPTHY